MVKMWMPFITAEDELSLGCFYVSSLKNHYLGKAVVRVMSHVRDGNSEDVKVYLFKTNKQMCGISKAI